MTDEAKQTEDLPADPTEALAYALALFVDRTEVLMSIDMAPAQAGSVMAIGRAAIAKWQASRDKPHPDTRRLDLIERHKLDVREVIGIWRCRNRHGHDMPNGESAREAIDEAGKALGEEIA